ncbi:RAF-like serine/threonine-protein kinase 20 [Silene latifolia]|uniref:RAF-like serine/threonine-protein kinase 20 n=1 Tax=Silene latifolia TaxID=37657 RepID=UPI003D78A59A
MDHPNEYNQYYNNYIPPGNEQLHPVSERFMQDATNCINMNIRPPEGIPSQVKPVHNFSIQTGEEFALEFMRDRALPRKPVVPKPVNDPHNAPGYMDLKGILGITRTEFESGSDISMLTLVDKPPKELERKTLYGHEAKSNHGSVQSMRQNSSVHGSSRAFHGYASSTTSDGFSTKLKVLCSFGGKVLPRPSDGKLRYAGGETRIIRISKDISWQELKQKTSELLEGPYTIKYQLPGEELDALVSVSSDEDLQNMMEECNVLGDGEGSKKLRLFLFTSSDLEEAHYSLSGGDVDSEFQYVVAVNCMSMGVRNRSGMHDLASSSANDLDALTRQNTSKDIANIAAGSIAAGSSSLPGGLISSVGVQSSQPILPGSGNIYLLHPHPFQGHVIPNEESKGYQQLAGHDVHPSEQLPREENIAATSLPGVSTQHKKTTEDQPYLADGKGILPTEEASGTTHNITSVKDYPELPPKAGKRRQERVIPLASDPLLVPRGSDAKNPENANPFDNPGPHEHAHSEPNSFDINHDELPAPPRPYLSMNIPREQGELLNRLTKSDDSLNSQFLMSHSRSSAGQPENNVPTQPALSNGPKLLEDEAFNFSVDRDNVPKQATSSLDDQKDSLDDSQTVECNSETTHQNDEPKRQMVGGLVEAGNSLMDVTQQSHGKQQDHASTLPGFNWGDNVSQTATSTDTRVTRPDILIDINDRFPRDLLTDIFSKAILSEESSSFHHLQQDGPGLSMNIENRDPKHWSFFQNLAKDDFRKDVSLIDQDHPGYSSGLTGETTGAYQFTTLTTDEIPSSHVGPRIFVEYSERELSGAVAANPVASTLDYNPSMHAKYSEVLQFDGIGGAFSDYEDAKQDIKHVGLPPLDATRVDFDITTLQIIKNEDLEELRELGSGTFGTVYHGKWRGTDVAIKRIKKSCFTGRSSEQERLTAEFWHEAEILSKLHHPNVVAFYGVVQDGPGGTLATVAEFMVDGSLRHVLLRKDRHLDRRKRLIIAMDAAFGMEYLHSKNIVHFDLKCDNLLVNLKDPSRPICKVGDFGLSKIKRNTLVSGGVRGTLPWMAPELLNGSSSKVSEKVDVFSFGIVLWEILTGEEPYANMHYGAIIGGIVNNTLRPPIPGFCDAEWRTLMEQCWAPNPGARPSFTEIAGRLRTMAAACPTKFQAQKPSH